MSTRTVYFDCYAGISGDMAVAALLDLGADFEAVRQSVRAMGIPGLDVERTRVNKLGIESERFIVQVHSSVQSNMDCHQTDVAESTKYSSNNDTRHRVGDEKHAVHSSVQSNMDCHQTDIAQVNNCSNHDNVRHRVGDEEQAVHSSVQGSENCHQTVHVSAKTNEHYHQQVDAEKDHHSMGGGSQQQVDAHRVHDSINENQHQQVDGEKHSSSANYNSNHDMRQGHHHHDSRHDEEKPHSHHHHHRSFRDIRAMIERADIPTAVKDLSISIFSLLATAEGRVHGREPEEVHFHEVGAEDSIADIIAFAAAWHSLGLTAARASSVNTGSGFVHCAHGIYPVPAPAVALLLEGIPVYAAHAEKELTTPTGAAILKAVCSSFGPLEGCAVRTGYGAGTRDLAIPNSLRAQLMEGNDSHLAIEIEANIDDMNPERYPLVLESLLRHGALDAWLTPLVMKQGRPAVLLSVLCAPERRESLCRIILDSTTTIGVRWHSRERMILERQPITLKLSCGPCDAKLVRAPSGVRIKPEIASIRRLADENGLDFVAVYDEAVSVALHTASTMNG